MEYDKKLLEKLAEEVVGLYVECKSRIDRIEKLGKELENSKK
jgi:hypothetical protein